MTDTPWGNSATLRERRLPPGPGTSREEVDLNQRQRLYAAMIAVATRKGYAETSVTDLIEVAGVSSSSFYRHFADKEACLLATLDAALTRAKAVIATRLKRDGPWEDRLRHAVDAGVGLIVSQPAAASLCFVESYAAGRRAEAIVDEAIETGIAQLLPLLGDTDRPAVPQEIIRAIAGGFRKIVHTHLHRGRERELPEHAPVLIDLALSYEPPPVPLRRSKRTRLSARGLEIDPLAEPGERIVRATMAVVAEKGYQATTTADIAHAAGVSLSTLYAHFDGKADAFDAALYGGRVQLLAASLPAHRRGRDWETSICNGIRAALTFLEAEPELTRLITTAVYTAGPEALERREQSLDIGRRLIERGVDLYAPEMKPIWSEALIDILYAMVGDHVRERGTDGLQTLAPLAIYLVLSPFVGAERACELANEQRRVRAPSRRGAGEAV